MRRSINRSIDRSNEYSMTYLIKQSSHQCKFQLITLVDRTQRNWRILLMVLFQSVFFNRNIQGGMNGLRGLVAGVGQDAALHERRPHDGASGQPNFMTAPSPSPMSQPPFSDRHSSIPAPQTMMHGRSLKI